MTSLSLLINYIILNIFVIFITKNEIPQGWKHKIFMNSLYFNYANRLFDSVYFNEFALNEFFTTLVIKGVLHKKRLFLIKVKNEKPKNFCNFHSSITFWNQTKLCMPETNQSQVFVHSGTYTPIKNGNIIIETHHP